MRDFAGSWLDWGLAACIVAAAVLKASAAEHDAADVWTGGVMFSGSVRRFADAIARAEGFFSTGNTVPKRNHNPGDLKSSSVPSIGADALGHLRFASDADGWEALYRQVQLIVDGRSRRFSLGMTIAQMAAVYAEAGSNWAANVAAALEVSVSTPLREVLV